MKRSNAVEAIALAVCLAAVRFQALSNIEQIKLMRCNT
jgi:hypothetical protein